MTTNTQVLTRITEIEKALEASTNAFKVAQREQSDAQSARLESELQKLRLDMAGRLESIAKSASDRTELEKVVSEVKKETADLLHARVPQMRQTIAVAIVVVTLLGLSYKDILGMRSHIGSAADDMRTRSKEATDSVDQVMRALNDLRAQLPSLVQQVEQYNAAMSEASDGIEGMSDSVMRLSADITTLQAIVARTVTDSPIAPVHSDSSGSDVIDVLLADLGDMIGDDAPAHMRHVVNANRLTRDKRHADARQEIALAMAADPSDATGVYHVMMGMSFREDLRHKDATEAFENALRMVRANPDATAELLSVTLGRLGASYYSWAFSRGVEDQDRARLLQKAFDLESEALELSPMDFIRSYNLVVTCLTLERWSSVLEIVSRYRGEKAERLEYPRANALIALGRIDEGLVAACSAVATSDRSEVVRMAVDPKWAELWSREEFVRALEARLGSQAVETLKRAK